MRGNQVPDARDAPHRTPCRAPKGWDSGAKAARRACKRLQRDTVWVRAQVGCNLLRVDLSGPRHGDIEQVSQAIPNGPVHESAMLQRMESTRSGRRNSKRSPVHWNLDRIPPDPSIEVRASRSQLNVDLHGKVADAGQHWQVMLRRRGHRIISVLIAQYRVEVLRVVRRGEHVDIGYRATADSLSAKKPGRALEQHDPNATPLSHL